ncbi:osmotically-inducible protein OsmY [Povalibacter uvarum]|uniref:Osmotically-inducible protein OsmY n=1 Tax=Povalibacter uvarum TaxID=732238 RepID=A0A841HTR1_9GAMM|nr:BON domain-containing protein [Povalibacter uvarum]MBB6095235.1 osmotically-inducible protein OsmY [Povalibacter uvarum]
MGYQSRDGRQSDQSRNQGRNHRNEEARRFRDDSGWDDENAPRSAEGIGDYGGYSDSRYSSGGRFGGYAEEESSYRGDYSPRHSRREENDWRDRGRGNYENQSNYERYGYGQSGSSQSGSGQSRFGQSRFERDSGYEGSRHGENEPDFRTQPWRDRSTEGWSGDHYPHRDFTSGRGGDYERGSSGRGYGQDYGRGSEQDGRYGSLSSAYDSDYRTASGYSGDYGYQGSSGASSGRGNRGKGPKGYERSDDRLKEVICERLSDDSDIDASEITVNVTGGIVKLTGTVDSRNEKYAVEEMIANCSGVKDVDNQLRVQTSRSSSQSSQSQRDNSLGYSASGQDGGYGQAGAGRPTTTTQTSTPSTKKQ